MRAEVNITLSVTEKKGGMRSTYFDLGEVTSPRYARESGSHNQRDVGSERQRDAGSQRRHEVGGELHRKVDKRQGKVATDKDEGREGEQ